MKQINFSFWRDLDRGCLCFDNMYVEVKRSDDDQGYIIDVFKPTKDNTSEELLNSITIWDNDLEE